MANTFQGWPTIKVGGATVAAPELALLESLVVDDHLHLPDTCTIVWRDPNRDVLDKTHVRIGSALLVSVVSTGRGQSSGEELFVGEITGIEASYDATGQRVMVRAYDQSHRMHRGRWTQAYLDTTDSKIATAVAQRCGLAVGEVEATQKQLKHVSQVNLTDWEFVKARARDIGFEVGVSDGKFFFRKPKVNQGAPAPGDLDSALALQLAFGADLLEFRPRISASAQVKEVTARGWDYKAKVTLVGKPDAAHRDAAPKIAVKATDVAAAFYSAPMVLSSRLPESQAEADDVATGMAREITSSLAEADGVARGNPKVRAGTAVSISAVAAPFVGTWTVTGSRHVFDPTSYRTVFVVSGRQERSLLGLASVGATSGVPSAGGPPIFGVVVGIVSNIKDPEGLHRVRLTFPWLSDDFETYWARMAMIGAGRDRGMVWLPEVGDEVLVAFEQGDVRHPYVIGALFNGKDLPAGANGKDLYDGAGRSALKGLKSRSGHRMVLRDGWQGHEGVWIGTGDSKHKFVLSQNESKIKLLSDGSIEITAKGNITVEATNITMKAAGDLTLAAQKSLSIQGLDVKIAGTTTVDVDGGMITLN